MVFSSHLFLFYFLPLTLLLYYAVGKRGRHLVLTLLSYAFYGWANPWFVLLMLASTFIDYWCGIAIMRGGPESNPNLEILPKEQERTRRQRIALTVSIVSNLSLLGFFKYFNFGVENYNGMMASLGLDSAIWDTTLRVTLPLGISFYTFQSMSYSIDVFRGDARGMKNPVDFACYVSMFPQLVAGPIIRFADVADQLRERSHTMTKFARGTAMFALGMCKKIMLANPCGKVADTVFDAGSAGVMESWHGVVAYAMQIYFDFSAYSDMAIGLGLMIGFVFPKNFDSPYKSQSITEFWRRWHISLSSWLRDYLYVPLGGNRKGEARTYVNLATVMLFGGLWHGSSWNFVIWGAIHGGWLAAERAMGKDSFYAKMPRVMRVLITFVIVLFAWVFFRSPDLSSSMTYIASMFGLADVQSGAPMLDLVIWQPYYIISFLAALGVAFFAPQSWDWTRTLTPCKAVLVALGLWVSITFLFTQSYNPFIYFLF
ncbi:MAG: alginate O-acetyltransferase complex protein AlgI [Neolewinella sp.]|jgi:alginate O-acetyltransferase complex protein AlgI